MKATLPTKATPNAHTQYTLTEFEGTDKDFEIAMLELDEPKDPEGQFLESFGNDKPPLSDPDDPNPMEPTPKKTTPEATAATVTPSTTCMKNVTDSTRDNNLTPLKENNPTIHSSLHLHPN